MDGELSLGYWRPGGNRTLLADARTTSTRQIGQALRRRKLDYLQCKVDGGDVTFLEDLPVLQGLRLIIIGYPDISSIVTQRGLREVSIWGESSGKDVSFSNLMNIETADFNCWSERYTSIFESASLRDLTIGPYPHDSLDAVSQLPLLSHLCVWDGVRLSSIEALRRCKSLKSLDLRRVPKLHSLRGIEDLDLESLSLDETGNELDVQSLFGLRSLVRLTLANCRELPSLSFVDEMPRLEVLLFHERTVIKDGDLSPIVRHHNIRVAGFANRSHYSHSCKDIWQCRTPRYTSEELAVMESQLNALM